MVALPTARQLAVVAIVAFALAVALPAVVQPAPHTGPEDCATHTWGVYESSGTSDRAVAYANLSDEEQALFREALEHEGEQFVLTDEQYETLQGMPRIIRYEGTDYRTQRIDYDCGREWVLLAEISSAGLYGVAAILGVASVGRFLGMGGY